MYCVHSGLRARRLHAAQQPADWPFERRDARRSIIQEAEAGPDARARSLREGKLPFGCGHEGGLLGYEGGQGWHAGICICMAGEAIRFLIVHRGPGQTTTTERRRRRHRRRRKLGVQQLRTRGLPCLSCLLTSKRPQQPWRLCFVCSGAFQLPSMYTVVGVHRPPDVRFFSLFPSLLPFSFLRSCIFPSITPCCLIDSRFSISSSELQAQVLLA